MPTLRQLQDLYGQQGKQFTYYSDPDEQGVGYLEIPGSSRMSDMTLRTDQSTLDLLDPNRIIQGGAARGFGEGGISFQKAKDPRGVLTGGQYSPGGFGGESDWINKVFFEAQRGDLGKIEEERVRQANIAGGFYVGPPQIGNAQTNATLETQGLAARNALEVPAGTPGAALQPFLGTNTTGDNQGNLFANPSVGAAPQMVLPPSVQQPPSLAGLSRVGTQGVGPDGQPIYDVFSGGEHIKDPNDIRLKGVNISQLPIGQAPQGFQSQFNTPPSLQGGGSTGGSSGGTGSGGTSITNPTGGGLSSSAADVMKYLQLSQEEKSTQGQLDNLTASRDLGIEQYRREPVAMKFIEGNQKNLMRDAAIQVETLEKRAARLQTERLALLDASKFALSREDAATKAKQEEERYNKEFGLKSSGTAFDQNLATQKLAEDKRQADLSNSLAQQKFNEDKRQFGLDYALQQQKIAADNAGKPTTADMEQKKQETLNLVNELLSPDAVGKSSAVGASAAKFLPFGQSLGLQGNRTAFEAKVNTLKANLTLENLKLLKGAMSDKDLLFLNSIGSSLDVNMGETQFNNELQRIKDKLSGAGGNPVGI